MRRSIPLLVAALAMAGCGSFKDDAASSAGASDAAAGDDASSSGGSDAAGSSDGSPGGGDDAAMNSDASAGDSGGAQGDDGAARGDAGNGQTTGAGPLGDLPSGYCCTGNADCRNRHCVAIAPGVQMCEDECDGAQSLCTGLLPNFTCTTSGADGFCTPPAGTTTCVPAAEYVHGTKPTGACCAATGNATSGEECLGGNCGATGQDSNPFVCENACDSLADCPSGSYQCLNIGVYSVCAPSSTTYTCQ